MKRAALRLVVAALIVGALSASSLWAKPTPEPAPVEEYALHEDGGILYTPLTREATRTDQLARYDGIATRTQEVSLGAFRLKATLPTAARAYDVIPIHYRLAWDEEAGDVAARFPLAVEAVAFEDIERGGGRNLYDLALPGRTDLEIEYLGSITAHLRPDGRHNMKPDFSDEPAVYPPFDRKPMVRSGVVEAGDLVWFKFRYTNTGETILDPEGMGAFQFYPELHRKNADGKYVKIGNPYNLYYRDLEYLYPGESHEIWMQFQTHGAAETPENLGLIPGDYRIRVRLTYRSYKEANALINMWDGPSLFVWDMPITVAVEPQEAPVAAGVKTLTDGGDPDKITRFIHTFEEFMTAFDCHLACPVDAVTTRAIEGTLHLQVAPWTKHIVLNLIATGPVSITSAPVPIDTDSDSLRIRFNADHPAQLIRDGLREPIVYSQTMADMRANVQLGPFPERHIHERLREMMDCGINVVSTTSMPWLYNDMHTPPSNHNGDAWKYVLDLARKEGMHIEGWGSYPFDRGTIEAVASWITGDTYELARVEASYPDGGIYISHSDPRLPEANAAAILYQFQRWGDLYCQMASGEVPISVGEDTRGWLRDDVNTRFIMGDLTVQRFRDWLRKKYDTIEATNAAWDTSFASFDAIEPEKNQVQNRFGHRWEYTDPNHPFHDWNAAVADLDLFRTEVRIGNYRDTLGVVRKTIPNATVILRTEGANVLVGGIAPHDPNPHFRHIYFSQRRVGAVAEVLQASGLVRYHSDYTTLPYTPSEVRRLVRTAAAQGIIPAWLPQFDNMRDIAINTRYGNEYQIHYNLPDPRKGYMMHVLTAVYPWFKATYEEGGIPGVLWEDYQCDGFVTETQKREMRFFMTKLREAIHTPEARRARTADLEPPSQDWRKATRALRSYRLNGE
ncbi:MAG: beta-galactosidase [Phycisphaerae bacterium]|nr:beta-galactosidase [Phycisphaerae bacterium]